jgi:hypothetical protein
MDNDVLCNATGAVSRLRSSAEGWAGATNQGEFGLFGEIPQRGRPGLCSCDGSQHWEGQDVEPARLERGREGKGTARQREGIDRRVLAQTQAGDWRRRVPPFPAYRIDEHSSLGTLVVGRGSGSLVVALRRTRSGEGGGVERGERAGVLSAAWRNAAPNSPNSRRPNDPSSRG